MAFAAMNGKLPEFGAIFMSNRKTMGECFERKLFGLPSFFAEFVKKVRAGMVLFLFEYERKKLYGVFQAISDGTINIVPNAYASSGKYFSAQVRFSVIWNCRPLFENEFRDAIRDNYYAPNKFNFGLSKDQVYRLLWLFNCRKVKIQKFLGEKKVNKRHNKVESGKLGLGNDSPMVGNLSRLSSRVPCSLDADFQHPMMSRTNSEFSPHATGSPLQKEQKHADISSSSASSGLGDFIPLSSPEDSDPTEIRNSSEEAEDLENNQIESCVSDCHEDSSFSKADIVPTHFGQRDLNNPSVAVCSDRGLDGNYQSNPVHQRDDYLWVKRLYSDTPKKRTSVFSRLNLISEAAAQENEDTFKVEGLNLVSEAAAQENEDTFKVENSVHEIMKRLQQRHDNWKKTRKAKDSSQENEDNAQNKRGSVFSRLNFASEGTVQEKEFKAKVNESINKIKENFQGKRKSRGREVFIRNNDDGKCLSVTVQVEMFEDASQAEEHPKDTWGRGRMVEQIPPLNLKRKGEMLKRQCKTEGKDCIGGMGVCLSEEQLKKIKWVKPIFRNQSSDVPTKVCDSCLNVQTPSQESSDGKKNSGSFEVSTRNESVDDNENGFSEKDIVPSTICPTICEVSNGEEGKGLIGKDAKLEEQGSAENSCLPVTVAGSLKTSTICPTICEVGNGEEGKGLIGKDAKLEEQGSAENSCLPVTVAGSLKTSTICPTICEVSNGEEGKGLIGKDTKLEEQGNTENICLPVAGTESLKTYQRRRSLSASPSIKDPDKEIIVSEENAECHMTSICTDGRDKSKEQNIDNQVEICPFNVKTATFSAEGLGGGEYIRWKDSNLDNV